MKAEFLFEVQLDTRYSLQLDDLDLNALFLRMSPRAKGDAIRGLQVISTPGVDLNSRIVTERTAIRSIYFDDGETLRENSFEAERLMKLVAEFNMVSRKLLGSMSIDHLVEKVAAKEHQKLLEDPQSFYHHMLEKQGMGTLFSALNAANDVELSPRDFIPGFTYCEDNHLDALVKEEGLACYEVDLTESEADQLRQLVNDEQGIADFYSKLDAAGRVSEGRVFSREAVALETASLNGWPIYSNSDDSTLYHEKVIVDRLVELADQGLIMSSQIDAWKQKALGKALDDARKYSYEERVIWVLETLIPGQPVENLQRIIEGQKVAGSFEMQP